MRMKLQWKWERLDNNTIRAKVIGGWILCHYSTRMIKQNLEETSESMSFIPDRDHEWIILPTEKPIETA